MIQDFDDDETRKNEKKDVSKKSKTQKKIEAAELLEDNQSTEESVRKKLATVSTKISEFAQEILKGEWISFSEVIRKGINAANTPEEIVNTTDHVRSTTYFLRCQHLDAVSGASPPPEGSLGHQLVAKIQALTADSVLREGFESGSVFDPLHLLDAQACYLGSEKLLEMKKIPDANSLARLAIGYSTLFRPSTRREAGMKGGESNASNQKPFKELVAKLVAELTPEAGWNSAYAASVVVANRIVDPSYPDNEYREIHRSAGLNTTDPQKTIYTWFLKDVKLDQKVQEFKIRLVK